MINFIKIQENNYKKLFLISVILFLFFSNIFAQNQNINDFRKEMYYIPISFTDKKMSFFIQIEKKDKEKEFFSGNFLISANNEKATLNNFSFTENLTETEKDKVNQYVRNIISISNISYKLLSLSETDSFNCEKISSMEWKFIAVKNKEEIIKIEKEADFNFIVYLLENGRIDHIKTEKINKNGISYTIDVKYQLVDDKNSAINIMSKGYIYNAKTGNTMFFEIKY